VHDRLHFRIYSQNFISVVAGQLEMKLPGKLILKISTSHITSPPSAFDVIYS